MSYLVDTNIYSEPVKPKPEPKVVDWLRKHEHELYVSTVTIGEIRRGIERLPEGKRKTQLRAWLQSICDCMKGRILSLTPARHTSGDSSKPSGTKLASMFPRSIARSRRRRIVMV